MNQTLREAATMFQQGRLEDAQRRCSVLVKTQPDNVDAHYLMGLIHERSMRYDEAVESFRKVLERDPKHVASLVNVGGLLTTLGRAQEAIDPLRAALKIDRDIFPARYNLARALNMTGNLNQAACSSSLAKSIVRPTKSTRRLTDIASVLKNCQIICWRTWG